MMEERVSFSDLSFGIQETNELGNFEAAEAFLGDGVKIEKIAEKPKEEKPKEEIPKEEMKSEEKPVDPFESEEKEEEAPEEEKKPEDEDDNNGTFEALAKDLFRMGIFTEQDEESEIKSPEELLERFNYEKQLGAGQWLDNFLGKFGEDYRQAFQHIFIDGVNPKDYFPVHNKIVEMKSLDLETEDAQKQVVREYWTRQGLEPEDIERKLQKAIDYDDLKADSAIFHKKLLAEDEAKATNMAKEKAQQEQATKALDENYKSSIQKSLVSAIKAREFRGFPITEKVANEVFDMLYTPKYQTPQGQKLTEFDVFILDSKKPENIEQRILLGLLKANNFDFSKIEKKAVSKESNKIFSELAQRVEKSKTRNITNDSTSSGWKNL